MDDTAMYYYVLFIILTHGQIHYHEGTSSSLHFFVKLPVMHKKNAQWELPCTFTSSNIWKATQNYSVFKKLQNFLIISCQSVTLGGGGGVEGEEEEEEVWTVRHISLRLNVVAIHQILSRHYISNLVWFILND